MPFETVTTSRSKRSTAGNRLRELLEQAHAIETEEGFEEVPDDTEFEAKGDIEDVFEEDFESTDEDIGSDEEDADRALEKAERAARRAEKQKGHYYHNPLASSSHPKSAIKRSIPSHVTNDVEPERKKRRVSVVAPGEESVADSPVGGDSVEGDQVEGVKLRRSGMRASTLAMKEQIDVRLREQKERNANSYPRPPRRRSRPLTQADLIATALQVEEENIESLRIWLEEEEERKRVNKIARKVVAGPRISWISRRVDGEKEKKGREKKEEKGKGRKGKGKGDEPEQSDGLTPLVTDVAEGSTQVEKPQLQQHTDGAVGVSPVSLPPPPTLQPSTSPHSITEPSQATTTDMSLPQPPSTATAQPTESKPTDPPKDQPYERNYLILSSIQGQANELKVLFGDHADWTALERIPIKHRSIQRKPPTCPFTGRPARYRHPTTLVPYANAEAFKLIERTLRHDFIWSEDRLAFLGDTLETDVPLEKADGMGGIEGWDDAARGWWTFLTPPEESGNVEMPQEDVEMATEQPSQETTSKRSNKKTLRQPTGKNSKKQKT